MKTKQPNGYIFYRGASQIDGQPIVAVAIRGSANSKTGNMVQTYILPDNGLSPFINAKNGNDKTVCGDCKHKPTKGKTCYVFLPQGANQVHKGVLQGSYPESLEDASIMCTNRVNRMGAYGNPSAVPTPVWEQLNKYTTGHCSYEHNWLDELGKFDPSIMKYSMASVDSEEEYHLAKDKGYRTFRVKAFEDRILPNEIVCPASEEMGKKVQCINCKLCSGNTIKAKDIVINVHGRSKNKFKGITVATV